MPESSCLGYSTRTYVMAAVLIAAIGGLGAVVMKGAEFGRTERVENIQAFAKLYGQVRYFHPSDAAADLDWDAFALLGAKEAGRASSQVDLKRKLESLFAPIAPTVQVYQTREAPRSALVANPSDTTDLQRVAWQHVGNGVNTQLPQYHTSRRIGRRGAATEVDPAQKAKMYPQVVGRPRAVFGQSIQLSSSQSDREVRFRARVETSEGSEIWAGVSSRPGNAWEVVTGEGLATVEQVKSVPKTARSIRIGAAIEKQGTAWIDRISVEVRSEEGDPGDWKLLYETSFEGAQEAFVDDWVTEDGLGTSVEVLEKGGRSTVRLQKGSPANVKLFEEAPEVGETVDVELGRGLSARVPLALWSEDGKTLRPEEAPPQGRLQARLDSFSVDGSAVERLGATVQAWNVFRHFYPYREEVEVEWNRLLRESLRGALRSQSDEDFEGALQEMIVSIKDGHGRALVGRPSQHSWPLQLDWVEGSVVISNVSSEEWGWPGKDRCARPGDVLMAVGGETTADILREEMATVSGSSQHKRETMLSGFPNRLETGRTDLLLYREGEIVTCSAKVRIGSRGGDAEWARQLRPSPTEVLEDSVGYVDVTRARSDDLNDWIQNEARSGLPGGLIIDVRGYPNRGTTRLIEHLWEGERELQGPLVRPPQIAYPDQMGYWELKSETRRARFSPASPTIEGPVVLLTDERAVSAAESFAGVLQGSGLAAVVGEKTAGTTGHINRTQLVGGAVITWTGYRAEWPDGSQFHLVGVRPDVKATRSMEGIREGRDEVLQKGLEVLERKRREVAPPRNR